MKTKRAEKEGLAPFLTKMLVTAKELSAYDNKTDRSERLVARVREFLVDWLPKHSKDPSMYWQTATALGRLKEPRGAAYLDVEAITEPRWSGVRGHILYALGQMGGTEAAAKLGQYLSTPHADKLGAAAAALARIDKDAARRHAKRLLASDRAKFIHWMDRSQLEKLAKED